MYTRRLDMIGANIEWSKSDHVITLAGTKDTWTPVCLARAGLIVWDPKGISKLTK